METTATTPTTDHEVLCHNCGEPSFGGYDENDQPFCSDCYADQNYVGCECEQDWSCPIHAGQATWIETRFSGLDD